MVCKINVLIHDIFSFQGVMKYSVSWKVLQDQLKGNPDYIRLLKEHCPKYNEHCKRVQNEKDSAILMESVGKEELIKLIGKKELSVKNFGAALFLSKRLKNYDVDKKKLGIFAVDFDALLRLDNLSTNLMSSITEKLNFDLLRQYSLIDTGISSNISEETINYLDYILYQLTHLENFPPPHADSAVIFVSANHDSYVPMNNIKSPADIWPGSETRSIDCGHVMGVLRYQKMFRDAIRDALSRL